MERVVSGRVLSDKDGRPVLGAIVELSGQEFETRRMVTNRDGMFSFKVRGIVGTVRVLDRGGAELPSFANMAEQDTDLTVTVEGAKLPRQPVAEKLIGPEVFDTIRLAVTRFSAHPTAALQAVNDLFCGLPPIDRMPELVVVADGALLGRGEDVLAYRALLDDIERWNHRAFSYNRQSLTQEEAKHFLSPDFLKTLVRDQPPDYEPVFSRRVLALTIGAAMSVASGDPVKMNRNIGILLESLCGFDPLLSLFRTARAALFGGEAERLAFESRMQIFAPDCDGDREPPRLGLPAGGPGPFPCGDKPPWPPDPGDPDKPLPGGDPCLPEFLDAFKKTFGRRHTFSIDDISPLGACPGEVITITGTGLLFEGLIGVVYFPTAVRGSFIPVEPLEREWTDTMIRVVVPEGACNGVLDLEIPGGEATVIACDREFDLFVAAADPFYFVGGGVHLVSFTATRDTEACLHAGDVVGFNWRACGLIDHAQIQIRDHLGNDIDIIVIIEGTIRRPARYTVPAFDRNVALTFRLEVSGPCGSDEAMEIVMNVQRVAIAGSDPFVHVPGSFENFLGNLRRNDLLIAPIAQGPSAGRSALETLLASVAVTEAAGDRLGIRGSGCSYTDIVVPSGTTRMIDPDGMFATSRDLDSRFTGLDWWPPPPPMEPPLPPPMPPEPAPEVVKVLERGLRGDLDDTHSVLSREIRDAYRAARGDLTPLPNRLIHVEAGIKMERLVSVLERLDLSMPTLGGGVPQSLAGAIGTGTHGSTLRLPPIADFIRAIHLVGPGGHQWWLEPASTPITDRDQMRTLKREGVLDPCLRVRYDDPLFNAALVSFGSAGIIYSAIVETIDSQIYQARTTLRSWAEAREILRTTVIEPSVPEPWFLDISMDPTGRVRLSTLELAAAGTEPSENPDSPPPDFVGEIILILEGLPLRIALALPLFVARESLRLLNPFTFFEIFREIREAVTMIVSIIRLIRDLLDLLRTRSEEEAARLLPNAVNLLWWLGQRMGIGGSVVDDIQNLFAQRERPTGTFVRRDHFALNWKKTPDPPATTLPANVRRFDAPIDRLIRSSEYIVRANEIIDFVEAILAVANVVRAGTDALVLVINLRFTQRTRATVGMQQHPFNGHVELFTIKGLNGNDEFKRRLEPVLDRFHAIPHWGQLHSSRTNYTDRYGERPLESWQGALDEIASASDTPNTFRHMFALSRGLLRDL